jgi:FAD-dependent oxidoreductase domain-containing protein 1
MMTKNYDVVFVGGALMAAATAYSLLERDPGLKIAMVEKDPTYQLAATPLALGGVRQQFTTRVNIRMARQSIEVFENFGEIMETKLGKPQIDFRQGGYLFLVSEEKWPIAMENAKVQKEEGVELEILSPEDLADRLPGMRLDDVVGGTVCAREGILDPQQVLQGYIKKVKEMGAEFIYDEVIGIETANGQATGVSLKSGDKISAGAVVNAAGPWAGEVAKMAGVELPVEPLPHDLYVCKISPDLQLGRAYTTFPSTTWYFQEHEGGDTMLTGKTKLDFKLEFSFTPDRDYFYDEIWPDLAERHDGFDTIKLLNVWRGCYEYNNIDFNAIIGEHTDLKKFYLINGFSGHGLMQAPAAGRGLAEMILYGEYKTLDLTEVGFQRFKENKLIVEKAII